MRKLVIINGPNNNFYGIRNKTQYGSQTYDGLIQELTEYGASLDFEVTAYQNNGEGAIIDYLQSLYYEAEKTGVKIPLAINPALLPTTAMPLWTLWNPYTPWFQPLKYICPTSMAETPSAIPQLPRLNVSARWRALGKTATRPLCICSA